LLEIGLREALPKLSRQVCGQSDFADLSRAEQGHCGKGLQGLPELVCGESRNNLAIMLSYGIFAGSIPRSGRIARLSIDDARRLVAWYVDHYHRVRLHSAMGYVTPLDKLEGRESQIFAARDRKPEEARRQRQLRRQNVLPQPSGLPLKTTGETSSVRLN
jgi:hypothetical protein